MSCHLVQENGPAYALGALEPDERAALEAHVAASPDCARELAEVVLGAEAWCPDCRRWVGAYEST